jgi:ABC-type multidrug transport system ATPase subunit
VEPNSVVGLLGESGSGKSTLGKAVVGLAPIAAGTIRLRALQRANRDVRRSWLGTGRRPHACLMGYSWARRGLSDGQDGFQRSLAVTRGYPENHL